MNRGPGLCKDGKMHRFAIASGWCLNGCGWRDDGMSAYRPQTDRPPANVIDITEPRHERNEP